MIDRIIEFSAAHKWLVILSLGVLAGFGWWSMLDTRWTRSPT